MKREDGWKRRLQFWKLFFSGSMLFFRGADDAELYDEIHYQHYRCQDLLKRVPFNMEQISGTFVFLVNSTVDSGVFNLNALGHSNH